MAFFGVLISSRRQMTQRAAQAQITAGPTASGFKMDISLFALEECLRSSFACSDGRCVLRILGREGMDGRMMGREAGNPFPAWKSTTRPSSRLVGEMNSEPNHSATPLRGRERQGYREGEGNGVRSFWHRPPLLLAAAAIPSQLSSPSQAVNSPDLALSRKSSGRGRDQRCVRSSRCIGRRDNEES